jgi:2-C-methyl-D-erythritol 2,4-cyclodiphosphate synthase
VLRSGIGYDAHRLVADRRLILGGVEIDYPKGLLGHSDGDVLCHAIADALLGASGLGDIGELFPDTDPSLKGARSLSILAKTTALLDSRGYTIIHVDATIVAQEPKLTPYKEKMRATIAEAIGLTEEAVSLKATTTEGMGFEGRGEGMSAIAVATVDLREKPGGVS